MADKDTVLWDIVCIENDLLRFKDRIEAMLTMLKEVKEYHINNSISINTLTGLKQKGEGK